MDQLFSIGELCKQFKLNVQTIRFYDTIGLLKPHKVDPDTNYRYYNFDQVCRLASIVYLKKIGYSLKEIENYLDSVDIDYTLNRLEEQSFKLNEQWAKIFSIDRAIKRKISFIRRELPKLSNKYSVKSFDERKYIPIGLLQEIYSAEKYYFYPSIAFFKGSEKWFGVYIEDLEEIELNKDSVQSIPAGQYYCGYHIGPYTEEAETIRLIRESAKDKYILDELSANFNIIDAFVEKDTSKFIVEVQIRILEIL